jgi:hypothetical protein
VSGALLTELFTPALRYSGVALLANPVGVASGFVPLAATAALAATGEESCAPALILVGIALVTTVAGWLAPSVAVDPDPVQSRGDGGREGAALSKTSEGRGLGH